MRILLALLLLTHCLYALKANENTYSFKNISVSDGLIHKTITCISQDTSGFLWVGTINGLSRYDGYRFKNFSHDENDTLSLHGSTIINIEDGGNEYLWLLTDKGIEYFNKKTETFHLVHFPGKGSNNSFTNICIDKGKKVWTYNEDFHFQNINLVINRLHTQQIKLPDNIFTNSSSKIHSFVVEDEIIWIASSEGIIKYDYINRTCEQIYHLPSSDYCHTIKRDGENNLLFPYFREGIFIVNTKTNAYSRIKQELLRKKNDLKILTNDIVRMSNDNYWIATTHGIFHLHQDKIDHYCKENESFFFDSDQTSYLFKDKENNIWIGTFENGLFRINNESVYIKNISRFYKNQKASIANIQVFSNGSLLYSNLNNCYYAKDYKALVNGNISLYKTGLLLNLHAIDDRYCMLISNDSLYIYDSENKHLSYIFLTNSAQCAYKDKDNIIWTGGWSRGLLGHNIETGQQYHFNIGIDENLNNSIYVISGDANGSLWLGSFGSGLIHIINPTAENPLVERYVYKKGENSPGANIIQCMYDDGKENLWIGTCGGGLNCFNKKTKTFTVYNTNNGLLSNAIESIIADTNGHIWFTSNAVSKFDIQKKKFVHFTLPDGVFDSYLTKSDALSVDGKLFFGSSQGLTIIDSDITPVIANTKTPLLTDFKLFGLTVSPGDTVENFVPYTTAITYTDSITLPYNINTFSIEFASIQYHNSQNISYKYFLEGVDHDWIPANASNRLAGYAGLQPNEYVFKVKESNGSGNWSKEKMLYIKIVPPWWNTWWFKLMVFLSVSGIITLGVIFRFRTIKRINNKLEDEINEQTKDLKQVNLRLKNQNSQMLEHQTVLELKNQQLNDAINSKDELMRILGHDFKNPLAGLLGISELLVKESKNGSEKTKKFAHTILSNTKTLYKQMISILDWSLGLDKDIVAAPLEINIETLLHDAISLMKENANHKAIKIATQSNFVTNAYIDPKMISTVFRNLLSNAIKFTPRNGSINILIQELDDALEISIIDTGIGISQEKQSSLFDSSQNIKPSYGTENEKGSGLGLVICKTFIDKNNGSLKISSKEGQGSIFIISLPKGQNKALKVQHGNSEHIWQADEAIHQEHASVLIIDDDQEILDIIQELFANNVSVFKAKNGQDGLYLAQNLVPDIIISDINLPGISGLEVCRVLKANDFTNHIPVLLITSMEDSKLEDESYLSGANDFIKKPFNLFAFKQKILSLLELKNRQDNKTGKSYIDELSGELPLNYENKITRNITAYILKNISNIDLKTETIANHIGISRTQLWRILKNTTGKSAGDFIRDIRLDKSTELIKTGKYRISEVAYEVGYTDPRYFTKCFVKKFGMSPSNYQTLTNNK